jgi:hypothetical protein
MTPIISKIARGTLIQGPHRFYANMYSWIVTSPHITICAQRASRRHVARNSHTPFQTALILCGVVPRRRTNFYTSLLNSSLRATQGYIVPHAGQARSLR